MSNDKPSISIIIPAYNESSKIACCLTSIKENLPNNAKVEIIVVDNGSTDDTYSIAKSFEGVRVLSLAEGNVGAVRNYGAKHSNASVLSFIDADCLITKGWIERAIALCRESSNTIFGGGCKLPSEAVWVEKYWLLENVGEPTLPKHLVGASLTAPRSLFNELGGFEETLTSGEDTDFSQRALGFGWTIKITHDLDVIHLGNAKTAKDFFLRQIWHSENYLKNPLKSLFDPVFILATIFITLLSLSMVASITMDGGTLALLMFFSALILPIVLSMKRIYRSKLALNKGLRNIHFIYSLDLIYLAARGMGIFKSAYRLTLKK